SQEDIRGLVRDALGINSLPLDNTQLGYTTMEGDTKESAENDDHGDEGKVDNEREPNDFESFHLCYKTKDDTYLQEATRDMMVIANREISSKVKELVGPEGIAEDAMVAQIAREVLNKLFGNEEPHCYGAGVTKSQISKFCCNLRRMRGEVLADENSFLKEKNMEKKLHEVYGMLKLFPAIPDLDYVTSASAAAASTCNKQPSSSTSPSPFIDEDHYSPVMDDPSFGY
nr:basic helix-loop-helix leucine zipper transcription factor [Tanacetum cinerariifolium]